MKIRAIITDIEGTTTPISFVKEVLFPFSYDRMEEFLRENWENPDVKKAIDEVEKIEGKSLSFHEIVNTLRVWIKEDRKITPLKQIQGMTWEGGYRSGNITGPVYPDAYRKLKEWWEKGIKLYVYSSGSVKAQKLLFSHTDYGDITYLFSGYFDTTIGSKIEEDSYRRISQCINLHPQEILFLSDNPQEVLSASKTGMRVYRVVREGDAKWIEKFNNPQIRSFEEVDLFA
ncbi:MAG: acireductone synthase [Hydrogenothermaceae bacterium]|nr:acireductone synthase [Hydrogenothermaceae bacterium]